MLCFLKKPYLSWLPLPFGKSYALPALSYAKNAKIRLKYASTVVSSLR